MKYEIAVTSRFKKDLKRAVKRGLDIGLLDAVVTKLQDDQALPAKAHDHALTGEFLGMRECHIQPDWLLIYLKDADVLTLPLVANGSHTDLFEM